MGLPRTFVGFSSTDIDYYNMMKAWKKNENIDFNFADCQLRHEIDSENEQYIKRLCRERINMAGHFIQLIGENTRYKYKYVRWEAEVALEKSCTIIGVNLDKSRRINVEKCPPIIRDIGAIFVPYSPKIIKYALENFAMKSDGNYHYNDSVYKELGYEV
jgi:hypothetical protein